jgi:hypothetical protein
LYELFGLGFIALRQIIDEEIFREIFIKLRCVLALARIINLVYFVASDNSNVFSHCWIFLDLRFKVEIRVELD